MDRHGERPDHTDPPPIQVAQVTLPAPAAIGKVDKVSGNATAIRNGVPVELNIGDPIFKGDVLQTGTDSALTVRFTDGTVFGLSASARITVNDMFYAGGSSGSTAFFSIVKGAIGLVAGRAAKTGEFSVETPVATMGIRGTAVKIEVAANGATKFSVMREPNGAVGTLVLFDKADRSHILATLQDVRTAVLFPGPGAPNLDPIRIAKTNDDLRTEGALVRDLFQSLRDLFPRRGSADPDFGFIVPVLDLAPAAPDLPARAELAPAVTLGATLTPVETAAARADAEVRTIAARGIAVEDGPHVDLGSASTSSFLITPPARLPAGVSFDRESGRFELDPSNVVFQSLGAGESATIVVHYTAFDGVSTRQATVTWVVEGRNDAPVARADKVAGLSEHGVTALNVTANDRDLDHDALTVLRWTQPAEGRIVRDGQGHLVFDPGTAFDALSAGQTATVTFAYTVSDGHGGKATQTATLTVQGEGTFTAPTALATQSGVLPETGQAVALALDAPSKIVATQADLDLTVTLGPLAHRTLNILYLIDVSGSTINQFSGETPVGDLNGDGHANTIIDAEIASLIDLTNRVRALGFSPADVSVTLVPFNGAADPAEGGGAGAQTRTFDLGASGDSTIADALAELAGSGTTNFETALQAAIRRLETLDPGHSEDNIVYFLSDGAGTGAINDEISTLTGAFHASIAAVGVGGDAELSILNRIDNTGGAIRIDTPSLPNLELAPIGRPFAQGDVIDLEVFVNGLKLADIGPEDLFENGSTLHLDFSAQDLKRFAGDHNSIVATVTLTGDVRLTASLDVQGALPRSTDLDL